MENERNWNAIYDVLVQECSAPEWKRELFLQTVNGDGLHEFRFIGALGNGGKIWQKADHLLKVTCYMEDWSEERHTMIERANARLFWL